MFDAAVANSGWFPLGASARVPHHPVGAVCEAEGFLGGNHERWIKPLELPCATSAGQKKGQGVAHGAVRGAVAAPGLFLEEPREGDAEREMRGGTRGARGKRPPPETSGGGHRALTDLCFQQIFQELPPQPCNEHITRNSRNSAFCLPA